jgi:PAS domain-containing protein
MTEKLTYEELEQKVSELEQEIVELKNISDQVENMAELRANLYSLIDNTDDIIVIRDVEGRVLLTNKACQNCHQIKENSGKEYWLAF